MGLYQLIFSVYMLGATFATSGISMAVTRLTAECIGRGCFHDIARLLRKSITMTAAVSCLISLGMFLSSGWLASVLIKDSRADLALRLLAPSIPFMGIAACLKGYFMGQNKVMKTSGSQMLEQIVRIGLTVLLLELLAPLGIRFACALIFIGNTVSEICSCAYLFIAYLRDKRRLLDGERSCVRSNVGFRKILGISIPLSVTAYVRSIFSTAENMLIPTSLGKSGLSVDTALSQYGMIKGMVMPILFFPSSFLSAFSSLLMTDIARYRAQARPDRVNLLIFRTMRFTFLFSLFIGAVFWFFAQQIGIAIYRSSEVGTLLRWLTPLVPFMYMEGMVDGILNAMDQQLSTMRYNVIDSILRPILVAVFVPLFGLPGFIGMMYFSNLFTSLLCLYRMLKVTKVRLPWVQLVAKPFFSALVSGMGGVSLVGFLGRYVQSKVLLPVFGILLSCLLYFVLICLLDCVNKRDFVWLKKTLRRRGK